MADTAIDHAYHQALKDLEKFKEIRPCDTFEQASAFLSNWCICGWAFDRHTIKEDD